MLLLNLFINKTRQSVQFSKQKHRITSAITCYLLFAYDSVDQFYVSILILSLQTDLQYLNNLPSLPDVYGKSLNVIVPKLCPYTGAI